MEPLTISFTIPAFDTYTIKVTEEHINDLRSKSSANHEPGVTRCTRWSMELRPGELILILERMRIGARPGYLRMESTCGQVFPKLDGDLLERIEEYFKDVWRQVYRGFSPSEGVMVHGIPFPIAEEIHEHLCRTINVFGVEFTLKRLPPGESSVIWHNKDLGLPEEGKYVVCRIAMHDFISENRRGIEVGVDICPSKYTRTEMSFSISINREGRLDYLGCGSKVAGDIARFLL